MSACFTVLARPTPGDSPTRSRRCASSPPSTRTPQRPPAAECNCKARDEPTRQGRHLRTCPRSISYTNGPPSGVVGATFRFRVDGSPLRPLPGSRTEDAATLPSLAATPVTVEPTSQTTPAPTPAPTATRSLLLPSWDAVASLNVSLCERIPPPAVIAVSDAFSWTVRHLSDGEGWLRLFAFAKCILRRTKSMGPLKLTKLLLERARVWKSPQGLEKLWGDALADVREPQVSPGSPRFTVSDEKRACPHGLPDTHVDASTLPDDVAKRAISLARKGHFSRAVAALSAARVADVNEASFAAMQERHPAAPPPVFSAPSEARDTLEAPSLSDVRKQLRKFRLGTAAGCSGLSAQHLLDLTCTLGNSQMYEALSTVSGLLMNGCVPVDARRHFFGGKLVALVKHDLSLRPIACGEILRRLAAKLLCAKVKKLVAPMLLNAAQIGVAVAGGADAMCYVARRLSRRWLRDRPRGKCFVKIDMKNAFNCVDRSKMLAIIKERVPLLYPYAVAAYGSSTTLMFGNRVVESRSGVQQGDPLGPLFFALTIAPLWEEVCGSLRDEDDGAATPLDLASWYLDDGVLAGDIELVSKAFHLLATRAAEYGLEFNFSKCEVIVAHEDDHAAAGVAFSEIPARQFLSVAAWDLLGTCLGDDEAVRRHLNTTIDGAVRKTSLVAAVPDAHVAFALLRYCCGFSLGVFAMRACGPVDDVFKRLDDATIQAFGLIAVGVADPMETRTQVEMPVRFGGFGLRPCAPFAALAYVASSQHSRLFQSKLLRVPFENDDDEALATSNSHPCVTHNETVASAVRDYIDTGARIADKKQRELSSLLEDVRALTWSSNFVTEYDRARINSATAPHSSAWLLPRGSDLLNLWFTSAQFMALCRLRLGMEISASDSLCTLCKPPADIADKMGHHSLKCIGLGMRTALHHDIRDLVYNLGNACHLGADREVQCFSGHPGQRCDVFLQRVNVGRVAIDVSIVHMGSEAALRHAAASPGGAATHYQKHKCAKYGEGALASNVHFRAMTFDTHGAPGEHALEIIGLLARAWGRQRDMKPCRSIPIVAQLFNVTLMRGVAKLLVANISSCPSPARLP